MDNTENKQQRLFTKTDAIVSVLCFIFSFFFFAYPNINFDNKSQTANLSGGANQEFFINPFDTLNIEAKAYYVLDVTTGEVLASHNAEIQLPLASLTKIMTAITALSLVPESTIITIEESYLEPEGDSGLFANEKWRLGDLLDTVLIESSNDGAFAVGSSVGKIISGKEGDEGREEFLESMNLKARELGMSQTYFNNFTGLDINREKSGGYGSSRDVSIMMSYAISKYPQIFKNTKYTYLKKESLSSLSHTAINTNKVIDDIPSMIASKTGYTDLAGGNLSIIFDAGPGRPISVTVLGSSINGRFEDVKNLSWATIDYISKKSDNL